MTIVKAKGKLQNGVFDVLVKKENDVISLTFNGEKDALLMEMLKARINAASPIGGTYYPDETEILAYYHSLKTNFFDELMDISVEGELETIPYEEGLIY